MIFLHGKQSQRPFHPALILEWSFEPCPKYWEYFFWWGVGLYTLAPAPGGPRDDQEPISLMPRGQISLVQPSPPPRAHPHHPVPGPPGNRSLGYNAVGLLWFHNLSYLNYSPSPKSECGCVFLLLARKRSESATAAHAAVGSVGTLNLVKDCFFGSQIVILIFHNITYI